MSTQPLIVSIYCMVYNHEPFIRQCLEGFVMQKTNFRFEAIVHDDASTDGTASIIREFAKKYPEIIRPIFETENQYSKKDGSLKNIMDEACKGKYIALCEGDDYWSNPNKLQMQVDFLEANPDYGMCYTDFDVLFQRTDKHLHALFRTSPNIYIHNYPDVESFVLRRGYVAPMTWLVRKELWPSLEQLVPSCDGTFVMFAHFLRHSKVKCLEEVTATYRVLEESAAHSKNFEKVYQREKSILNTQYMLIDAYGLSPSLKDECRELHLRRNLAQFVANGKLEDVDECRRMIKDPTNIERILFFLSMTSLGRKIVYYARKNRNN